MAHTFRDGQRYNVTIENADIVQSERTGSKGVQIAFLSQEHGSISHTIWITPRTQERAAKDLETLGVKPEQMVSASFWACPADYLHGARCSIKCREEEWKGKPQIKVAYVNPWRDIDPEEGLTVAQELAAMFGGKPAQRPKPAAQPDQRRRPTVEEMQRTPAPAPPPAGSWEATDDDIPF